jgi:proteasomal ATPase-associated factor 1
MAASSGPIFLPQIALQHDFASVFADVRDNTVVAEDIYLSCYRPGSQSIHGKVTVSKDETAPDALVLESRGGVELTRSGSHTFSVSCPALSISETSLHAPYQTIDVNKTQGLVRRISAFDASPDRHLIATGHFDGAVTLLSTAMTSLVSINATKKLHMSTVLSLRFFPSSKVLLSASSDFSLNIISTATPSGENDLPLLAVPRVLKGHKSGVTDTAILGVGRNVLSCSKDGTIRLWDVGEARKIGSSLASEEFKPIIKMAVSSQSVAESRNEAWSGLLPPNGEPRDVASGPTSAADDNSPGNVIYAALNDGSFNVFDLRARNVIYTSPKSIAPDSSRSGLSAIAYDARSHILATGSQKGIITLFDARFLPASSTSSGPSSSLSPAILLSFQRSNASIDDLLFVPPTAYSAIETHPHLLVAPADGFPFRASVHPNGPRVVEEYVGFADEGVRVARMTQRDGNNVLGDVWCVGDDGIVRRY